MRQHAIRASWILCVTAGCAGDPGPATFEARVSAASGGMVTAGGATLVIPPGALGQDTTITVTISAPGSSLPDSSTVRGSIFDLGPDGTTFTTPATLTLPMAGTAAANERAVISLLDPIANRWVDLTSSVTGTQISAQVSHFTPYAARLGLEPAGFPRREWHLSPTRRWGETIGPDVYGEQTGGEVRVPFLYGIADPVFEQDNGQTPGLAMGEVYSSSSGETFWAYAESPSGDPSMPLGRAGGTAYLRQYQSYVKRAPNATLQVVLNAGFLAASDHNGRPLVIECHGVKDGMTEKEIFESPCIPIWTSIAFKVVAYRGPFGPSSLDYDTFANVHGGAEMYGFAGIWEFHAGSAADSTAPLWTEHNFTATDLDGRDPLAALNEPVVVNIDVSAIEVCPPELPFFFCGDKEFTVFSFIEAEAWNARGRESGAAAFLRDPQNIGGTALLMTGLEATNNPLLVLPPPVAAAPLPCASGPDPAAGVLQFSSGSYAAQEGPSGTRSILVTRTQGSQGAVSVIFSASDGTAVGGVDYIAPAATVLFADGDTAPRAVEFAALPNDVEEPDKTVTLTLSEPGGCATLGAQATAVLTILDDDAPFVPPPSFTIGGTVTGLVGTGLVLQNLGANDLTPGNGPFTFTMPLASGVPYEVTVAVQPHSPVQACTVDDGSGNVAGANITNVTVTCVTVDTTVGLDPSFGIGGKVTTGMPGGATAMALQPDGKIVLVGGKILARYTSNGSVDMSFGTAGAVTVLMGTAQGVAIQPDGKIVVAGIRRTATDDFAVERYGANGAPDTSFGAGGSVTTDFNGGVDRAWAVLIQTDGKIVVAGHAAAGATVPADNDFAVARYTGSGAPDMGFGMNGKVTTNIAGRTDLAFAAALQPDGRIVLTGRVSDDGAGADVGLVRYDENGSPDPGFGIQGIVRTNLATLPSDVALQTDGKILVAVQAIVGGKIVFGVARFKGDGAPDTGFGSNGLATVAFSTMNDYPHAVAVQSDGRIVLAGQSSNLSNPDFAIARFTAGGTLDPSFDTDGKLTVSFFDSFDGAECAAIQTDGKIVVGGFARNGTSTALGLVRVLP